MQVAVKSISYREANPGKFNNRVRNKMYYTQVRFHRLQIKQVLWSPKFHQAGGVDLLKAKWKKLSE